MNAYEEHAKDLAELGHTVTFEWAGQTFSALASGSSQSKSLEAGGFDLNNDLNLTCVVAQFGKPAEQLRAEMLGTGLVYAGKDYRIDGVTVAPEGWQIRIEAAAA